MAKTARAAIEDLLTCESCHAFYYVERADDGARTRLRCTSCGHSRDVLLSGAKSSKWTLIDPNGEVSTFGAWEDLVRAAPVARITSVRAKSAADAEPPSEEGRKSLSGSALLDITPTPIAPKLALLDSAPQLPGNVDAESGDKVVDPQDEDLVNEALVESLDSLPATEVAPVAAAVAPVAKKPDWDEDEAEVLSVRDIQVIPEPESAAIPTPAAPPAGKLRTLPPARIDGPPPPTITFESPKKTDDDDAPEAKSADATSETTMKTVTVVENEPQDTTDEKPAKAKVDDAAAKTSKADKDKNKDKNKAKDKGKKAEDKDPSRTRTTDRPAAKSAAGGAEAAKATKQDEEEGGRGWVLPAIGVAVAATVVWWIASSPTAPTTPESHASAELAPESTVATATATATAEPTPPATAETPTAVASATAAPTAAETTSPTPKAASADVVKEAPTPTGTTTNGAGTTNEPKKKAVDATSLADALDKAGAAKRAGNLAAARELYGRVLRESPSNVEAHGGLGDVARAQGDLPAAKASYQKALASSPNYGPAVLGLADTLWDMGDRAGAQTQYAAIVRARGANAPERAVARSTGK